MSGSVLLYLGLSERGRIARLRQAAEQAPLSLADTATQLYRRQTQTETASTAGVMALRFGFLVSFALETWPGGIWRRLTVSHPNRAADLYWPLVALLEPFGFAATIAEGVVWRGQRGARGVSLNIAEPVELFDEEGSDPDEIVFDADDDADDAA